MKDFTLALIQQASPLGRKQQNLESTVAWTRKAAGKGAGLICFPELNITGHGGHRSMITEAERVPDGESCRTLAVLAHELGVYICAGIAEFAGATQYNTQFIVGPDAFVGKQRKVHLSGDEYFYFRHGTQLPVHSLPFAEVGIAICYDNNVPEVQRCLAVAGAELILAVHAARIGKWPRTEKGRRDAVAWMKRSWKQTHAVRARDNGAYVAVCNTVGQSAKGIKGVDANHAGGCIVMGPDGELVAESRSRDIREEMVIVPLKTEALTSVRSQPCHNLRTRRPESFGILSQSTD